MSLVVMKGLTDDVVLQRQGDAADVVVEGTAPEGVSGSLRATISRRECPLENWDGRQVGGVSGGRWKAEIREIPTGGPYVVEFSVDGNPAVSVTIRGVLVGDLWILAGQSNMEGVGDLINVETAFALYSRSGHGEPLASRGGTPALAVRLARFLPLRRDGRRAERSAWPMSARTARKAQGLGLPFAKALERSRRAFRLDCWPALTAELRWRSGTRN